jgi:hypothetical protein
MSLATLLVSLSAPIAKKVLTSIGVGVVTYAGAAALLTTTLNAAKSTWQGLAPDLLSLLALAGIFEAMSIIAGALIASVSMIAFKRLGLMTGG